MTPCRCTLLVLALMLSLANEPARAQFVNHTAAAGIPGGSPTWGAVAVDMDQDGDIDLMNPYHFFGNVILTNDGTGNFSSFGAGNINPIAITVADRHAFTFVDLDGDEILDVLCSHGGSGGCGCSDDGNELWKGLGNGSFQLQVGSGGMADTLGRGRAFSAADIDLDGDPDLFHAKSTLIVSPNSLYRNDGGLAFTDIAPSLGLDETTGTAAGLFADFDDDGDPDLLVGGDEEARPTILWRNDGASFTDVTASAFGSLPVVAGADWGDYDNDGDEDLAIVEGNEGVWDAWLLSGATDYWFFSHFRFGEDGVDAYSFDTPGEDPVAEFRMNGRVFNNLVYLGPNQVNPGPVALQVTLTDSLAGAPTFTPGVDVGIFCWRDTVGGTWEVRVSSPPGSFGNFSGRIFTTNGVFSAADSSLEQVPVVPAPPRVFRNDGGTFTEVTGPLGFTTSENPRQVTWVDFDLDGDLDLHQVNKGHAQILGEDDILWRNDGATFTALTGAGWVPGDSGYLTDGGVWGDCDGDGDPDLLLEEGSGPVFFSAVAPTIYYRNDTAAGNWVKVIVPASPAGGTPIGAKVTCWAGGQMVHRRVRADSWEGFQRPLTLTLGLGAAASYDSLVVEWPDGQRRVNPVGVTGAVIGPGGSGSRGFVGAVHPQPSFGRQSLVVDVPDPGRLHVTVHDVAGRRVRVLSDGARLAPGPRTLTWDGRDAEGHAVTPGVYFLRGEGDLRFVRKSVRLR